MNLNPSPCYNCIVLMMCKDKVRCQYRNPSRIWQNLTMLSRECVPLYKYIQSDEYHTYNIWHRRLAAHYLSGMDLGGNDGSYTYTDIEELYNFAVMENPHKDKSK